MRPKKLFHGIYDATHAGSDFFFDALNMTPTQSLNLASQFEVPADLLILQNPEAIYDGDRAPRHFANIFRLQAQIRFVANGKDHCIATSQGFSQIAVDRQVRQPFLVPKEAREIVADRKSVV